MQFLGNFGEIVCWRPPLGSWRPLLGEILDPPLAILAYFSREVVSVTDEEFQVLRVSY